MLRRRGHGTEGGAAQGGVVCNQLSASALIKQLGQFYGVTRVLLGLLLPAAHARAGVMLSNQQFIPVISKFS